MACMCGDLYCPSCGPAQGNYKCPNCGVWSMDGGCADPEACAKATRAVDDAMAASYDAEKELVDHLKQVHGMTIMQYAMSDTGCEVCRKLVKKM